MKKWFQKMNEQDLMLEHQHPQLHGFWCLSWRPRNRWCGTWRYWCLSRNWHSIDVSRRSLGNGWMKWLCPTWFDSSDLISICSWEDTVRTAATDHPRLHGTFQTHRNQLIPRRVHNWRTQGSKTREARMQCLGIQSCSKLFWLAQSLRECRWHE